ncbi:uncharacterized protein KY384_007752 [Bacidia gigantensis]|uniref:uncharacterized protein n=1 Tax=Bacidia gigantensis TaxID=2732470 RepID=UPI001D050877|nr:uncharacterized protein KY384_007752 [Bacidia gigantensis]KAG8527599.1 hypothetical protein KY384_007752 [Bacidia gigantensis]
MNDDEKINQVYRKIEREKVLINAANAMRQNSNPQVQASLDSQIRESRRGIEYLEESMRELQMRRMENMDGGQAGGPQPPTHGSPQQRNLRNAQKSNPPTPPPKDGRSGYVEEGDYGDPANGGYMNNMSGGSGMMPPRAPFGPPGPDSSMPRSRPNYTKLDLIKYDTSYLGPRIQLMLSQLEFKLSVEKQYKDGVEKMVRLYQDEGDKKSRADAEGRRIESNQKIQLLRQALKRYEDLHVDMESTNDAPDDDSLDSPNLRKPLTGSLSMTVHAVKDVDHAATGRFARGPETFVIMKVEDSLQLRTKATRIDRWHDEHHTVDIEKANEIELTVYDKAGNHATPIGMLWIRIADIAEEMRRKKIEADLKGSQWVTADKMGSGGAAHSRHDSAYSSLNQGAFQGAGQRDSGASGQQFGGPQQPSAPGAIDAWFSLEPVGRIQLSMSFSKAYNHDYRILYSHSAAKQVKDRRPFDIGLNRKGAIRQRKEEVHELYGHRFVLQQFYTIMRCALCGDYLKYSAGMQCEDCKFTCHQKCYSKVVTKCISKSNAETDPDEEKVNHQCGLSCHATCAHLVPDFCGMPMAVANEMLAVARETKDRQGARLPSKPTNLADRTLRQGTTRPSPVPQMSFAPPPTEERPGAPITDPRRSHGQEELYPAPTPQQPQGGQGALNAAQSANQSTPQQRRPDPQRTASSQALAAAGKAMDNNGKRPSAQRPSTTTDMSSLAGMPFDPNEARTPVQPQPQSSYNPQNYAPFDRPPQVQPPAITKPPVQQPPYPEHGVSQYPSKGMKQAVPSQQGTGRRIGLEHFNFLAVLGKGNFGKVMLAETKATKKLYAIKVLKKEFIIENDEVESTKSEKRVFLIANKERHPFLLNLHACFQTETRVYFVMEYISGGDLMLHIQRGQFGSKRAQFYAAEVCLALKYFHENGVIYRDLKLDNILLTLDGHIKIADYGLCKEDMWYGSNTSTFCGTPEFMAPEILLDKKYGRAVDWWAFGVLIYQMLLQQSPFRGEDEDEIYDAILADEPLYPIHMPRDSVSILQKLLTREPELRLGSGPTDAQEVMSQPFFKTISWEDVRDKRMPPPFRPEIKNATDTSNFDSEFTSVTPVLTPVQSVLTQAMQEEFRGFSYSADFV